MLKSTLSMRLAFILIAAVFAFHTTVQAQSYNRDRSKAGKNSTVLTCDKTGSRVRISSASSSCTNCTCTVCTCANCTCSSCKTAALNSASPFPKFVGLAGLIKKVQAALELNAEMSCGDSCTESGSMSCGGSSCSMTGSSSTGGQCGTSCGMH